MTPYEAYRAQERRQAIVALLQKNDEPGAPPRRHRLTCAGHPRRREFVFRPLLHRWLAQHYVARDREILPGSLRKGPRRVGSTERVA